MTTETKRLIRSTVGQIYRECSITDFPIEPLSILTKLGIAVIRYSELPYRDILKATAISEDGFCGEINSKKIVFYNDSAAVNRMRFTLMHELGHIVLRHQNCSKQSETEANFFATNMLLPEREVISFIQQMTRQGVADEVLAGCVSKFFMVSRRCAAIRIEELKYSDK